MATITLTEYGPNDDGETELHGTLDPSPVPHETTRVAIGHDEHGRLRVTVSSNTLNAREINRTAQHALEEWKRRRAIDEMTPAAKTGRAVQRGGVFGAELRHTPEDRQRTQQKYAAWSHAAAKFRIEDPQRSDRTIADLVSREFSSSKYKGSPNTIRRHIGSPTSNRSNR